MGNRFGAGPKYEGRKCSNLIRIVSVLSTVFIYKDRLNLKVSCCLLFFRFLFFALKIDSSFQREWSIWGIPFPEANGPSGRTHASTTTTRSTDRYPSTTTTTPARGCTTIGPPTDPCGTSWTTFPPRRDSPTSEYVRSFFDLSLSLSLWSPLFYPSFADEEPTLLVRQQNIDGNVQTDPQIIQFL